jgi:type II secretory pathway pseudopilin PulG
MKRPIHGFTLIEIMVVLACMMLLLIPAWKIFQQGTKSSLQGMLQIETTLEARKVLKGIGNDLKKSCWIWDDANIGYYTLDHIVKVNGTFPGISWSFLSYPQHGDVADAIPTSAQADPATRQLWRRVSRITYRLEPSSKKSSKKLPASFPMYSLIREEKFNPRHPQATKFPGGVRQTVVSDRVLFFDIRPLTQTDAGGHQMQFFWITLQLVDSIDPNVQLPTLVDGKKLLQRSKNLIIADFFDVVYPEILSGYRQLAGPRLKTASEYCRVPFYDPIEPSAQK